MDTKIFEDLVKDINDRLTAIGESTSEQHITGIVKTYLDGLLNDENFVRKMRFGNNTEPKLVGTKYARFNLSLADIEFLYDLQEAIRGQKKATKSGVYEGPSEELRNTFGAISEAFYLSEDKVREIDKRAIDDLFPRIPLSWFHGKDRKLSKAGAWELTQAYQSAIRAMDTAESGYGSQLVGAQYVGDLWEAARAQSRIFNLIRTFEMTDPTAYLPVEVGFPELLFVGESTTYNAANYATVKTGSQRVQVDAKKFVMHQMWSGEMEEDSIIPFIPFLRGQVQKSMEYYPDSLVLNGDTTNAGTGNINLDDADPDDTKHYLAFDGIRHAGLVDNTANKADQAGAITLLALQKVKGRMIDSTNKADWGHPNNPNDLVYVSDPETADQIAILDEVLTWYQMQGKSLLNGQVAQALGHPVISSIAVSKTEADGKVSTTGSNNTKGQTVTFNPNAFVSGWRRRVKLETERIPATDQSRLVLSLRLGFGRFTPTGAASGIEAADVVYDISL